MKSEHFGDAISAREAGVILGATGKPLTPETVHRYRREGKYRGRFRRYSTRIILYSRADIEKFARESTSINEEYGES